ncbi:MAG: VWA domain-containing protein [Gammaproteobacteria bacterium]|nr:VWA domain-containing protein [Gammaproteobacteria bacterium]MDE0251639.1 VWA domain-containing protein [Gammaproteobacteria bacterium]MDE0403351.1 VWA domain-containing protein [Gammaproteobacteria bacterium]
MDISFSYPIFAFLLILVPVIWLFPMGSRRVPHLLIRSLILLLVTLGLMRPVFVSDIENKHFAIVLDQSPSLSDTERENAAQTARELSNRLGNEGEVSVVQIGGDSPILDGNTISHMQGNSTPLSDALEVAAQAIPPRTQGSVTVISDGLATDRHWGRAFDHLQERGIPVNTIALQRDLDLYISGVDVNDVRAGDNLKMYVDVVGTAPEFVLEVARVGDEEILAETTTLSSVERKRVELSFRVENPGFLALEIRLRVAEEHDADLTNNSVSTVVPVQDPVRVLYLGERQQGAADDLRKLLGIGFAIDAPDPSLLDENFSPGAYDVVLLDDVPTSSFAEGVLETLAESVQQDGLGLIHSGGEAAFGDGGYHDSPITELFPVEIIGDQDKIDPSVGLAIILDTSGSMAGSRIELAKHIARLAVRRMQPHDRIGIVEFYGNKHWAVPMQPASNKIEIDRAIGRMKAIGGTILYPAVQEAYYGLQNVNTRFKHIILITDAGVEQANYEATVRRINRDRITVSTILVGQGGHNQIMSDIANWGGGRFYSVGNQFQLVEMIFKQSSTKKSPMYKRGAFEVVASRGPGWWGEIDQEAIVPIQGYVEVDPKDGAEVLLSIADMDHPIVSTWLYGLGRVTTFASEPVGEGTRSWNNWSDYPEFLGRLIRKTAPEVRSFEIDTYRRYGKTTVIANRVSRNPQLKPSLNRYELDNTLGTTPPQFNESAPGLFESQVRTPTDEDVYLGVGNNFNDREWRVVSLATSDEVPETQVDPRNAVDFGQLSNSTGGLVVDEIANVDLSQNLSPDVLSYSVTQIAPWLFLLALFTYLSDLIYRRWPRAS